MLDFICSWNTIVKLIQQWSNLEFETWTQACRQIFSYNATIHTTPQRVPKPNRWEASVLCAEHQHISICPPPDWGRRLAMINRTDEGRSNQVIWKLDTPTSCHANQCSLVSWDFLPHLRGSLGSGLPVFLGGQRSLAHSGDAVSLTLILCNMVLRGKISFRSQLEK